MTFGSYINRHSNERQRLRPAGLQPGHVPGALHGRQDRRRLQQRHPDQPLDQRRKDVHRQLRPTCARCPPARDGDNAADQFWQWAAFDPRAGSRSPLRPRLRQRRADRLLRRQPVGHARRLDFGTTRVTTALDAAADAVRGRVLRRLQRPQRRRRRPPGLDGHARPGPVRLPRLRRQRHPAAERLHRGADPTRRRPTTRTSTRTRSTFPVK